MKAPAHTSTVTHRFTGLRIVGKNNTWNIDARLVAGMFQITRIEGDITDIAAIRDAVRAWAVENDFTIDSIKVIV